MKPFGLFCRLSVSSAAGVSHSLPKIRAMPFSEPQPPAGPSYSTVSSVSCSPVLACAMFALFRNCQPSGSPTYIDASRFLRRSRYSSLIRPTWRAKKAQQQWHLTSAANGCSARQQLCTLPYKGFGVGAKSGGHGENRTEPFGERASAAEVCSSRKIQEQQMQDRCALGKPDLVWRGAEPIPSSRIVAEERPVALTYNGSTYAVMMASPADLHDFGIGFSLNEGTVEHSGDIISIEVVELEQGCEVRMWLDRCERRSHCQEAAGDGRSGRLWPLRHRKFGAGLSPFAPCCQ